MHVWHRAVVVFKIFWTKALFDSCKSISGKYSIFQKCYFSERKMFSCVWLHFKKCFEKYFLVFGLLTFSRLPNEYIISFIPQYKHKQNPEKKSANPVKLREEGRERGDWVRRGLAIGAVLRDCGSAFGSVIGLPWRIGGEMSSAWPGVSWTGVSFGGWALFFLSLSLFCAWPGNSLKVKWKCKTISRSKE